MLYTHLSLDAGVPDTDIESLHERVPCGFNLERLVNRSGSHGGIETGFAGMEALGGGIAGTIFIWLKAFLHKRAL